MQGGVFWRGNGQLTGYGRVGPIERQSQCCLPTQSQQTTGMWRSCAKLGVTRIVALNHNGYHEEMDAAARPCSLDLVAGTGELASKPVPMTADVTVNAEIAASVAKWHWLFTAYGDIVVSLDISGALILQRVEKK
ncbi:hypothetical protein GGI20_004236 [Coemansia sp. BCRC 34301]|nr:hypothetical protein GGI20_004236 [Coemansia sp. BCRC 34301]